MSKVKSLFVLTLTALSVMVLAFGAQAANPSVKLGIVAQRYPWNGLVDVSYKAESLSEAGAYAAIVVAVGETVMTNSIDVIVNGEGQAVLDLRAIAPETMGVAKFSIVADKTPSWPIDVQTKVAGEGSVSGGKQCSWGTQATLTATPAPGFSFIRWSDGDTTNPRTVTVDGTVYTAEFGLLTAAKLGAKANGYPYFDQTYSFATNGLDNATSKYWGWAADFYVSFSKAIPAKTLKLATRYPNKTAEWDQSIKGDDLEAGVEYSLSSAGTYGDLCNTKTMDFAVWAYDNQNLDTKMTVWFKMTNETEQITQKLAEYTFEELVKVVIRPSGVTEQTAPYAIEMPAGSGYYVITNHSCQVADEVLTMTGLKGGETVQLNYLCNIVSNAHENTTFLVMSYPKKTHKGAYLYLPEVIPGSMDVCKGFNYSDKTFNTALNLTPGDRDWAITEFTGDLGLTKPGAVKVSGTGEPQNVTLTSVTIDDNNVTFVATGAVDQVISEPTGMTLSGVGFVEVWPQSNAGEITGDHILGYSNVTFTVDAVTTSTDAQKATYTATADKWDYVDDMPIGGLVKHWVGLPSPAEEKERRICLTVLEADIKLSYVLMRCTNLVEQDWTTVSPMETRAESSELSLTNLVFRKIQLPQLFYKYQVSK